MDPRGSLDAVEKRKIFPLPGIEPQLFSGPPHSVVTILTELSCVPHILYIFYHLILVKKHNVSEAGSA
jgi:hypothetical protein